MKEFFVFSQATLRSTRDGRSNLDSFREFYNKAINRQGETFIDLQDCYAYIDH